jgi:hypothetical protein
MPWTPADATTHTQSADTPHLQELWSRVANSELDRSHDEGRAIRIANSAVTKAKGKRK